MMNSDAEPEAAETSSPLTILIVDAEDDARRTTEALSSAGHSTSVASSVEDAEEVLADQQISVVVLEMALPTGNGLALLPKLSAGGGSAPGVVIYTKHDTNDVLRRRALEQGASEFLGKGIGADALLAAIARCTGGTPEAQDEAPAGDYILVVDDELVIRRFISLFFKQHGFETVAAPNADAARDQILKERPLAVMLDIEMPGRSGLDLLRELNAKGIKPPTVIITGVEEHRIGVEAESLGIIGFLPKPCNRSYMTRMILPKIEMLTR